MIADKTIPEKNKDVNHLSKVISDEIMRLKFQVDKVLQMAIFEKLNKKLFFAAMDVHNIIDKAVDGFSLQVKTRNGSIKKDF